MARKFQTTMLPKDKTCGDCDRYEKCFLYGLKLNNCVCYFMPSKYTPKGVTTDAKSES